MHFANIFGGGGGGGGGGGMNLSMSPSNHRAVCVHNNALVQAQV